MSNDSKLVTIYKPKDRAEYLVITGLLDSAGIEYFSLNEGVQNLIGGEISYSLPLFLGGFNVAAGAIEIQVAEENVEKATKKAPTKTAKEKRADKKLKKANRD